MLAFQNLLIDEAYALKAIEYCIDHPEANIDDWMSRQKIMPDTQIGLIRRLIDERFSEEKELTAEQLDDFFSSASLRGIVSKLSPEQSQLIPGLLATFSSASFGTAAPQERSIPIHADGPARFRIIRKHAEGGLGVVFVAEDQQLRRTVALKQIKIQQSSVAAYRDKFQFEAEVTGQLEHPGIVPIYALGTDTLGRPYYAMRFIQGESLRDFIDRFHRQRLGGKIFPQDPEFRQLIRRLIDVCHAIEYAHQRGVLHRDLKPGNIMIGKHGETLVVDWGLAKSLEANSSTDESSLDNHSTSGESRFVKIPSSRFETAYGTFQGTVQYAPPEQLRGELNALCPASDVFSLGAILHDILAGKPIVEGSRDLDEVITQISKLGSEGGLRVANGIPQSLVAICRKALAFDAADRYSSVSDFTKELQNWLDDQPLEALPDSIAMRIGRWMRNHRSTVSAAIASLALVTLGSVAMYFFVADQAKTERKLRLVADLRKEEAEQANKELVAAAVTNLRQSARVARAEGAFKSASSFMQSVADSQSFDANDRLQWASDLYLGDDPTAALVVLDDIDITKLIPEQLANYWLLRGDCLTMSKDDEEGFDLLRRALQTGLLSEANRCYAEAITSDSANECLELLGRTLKLEPRHPHARARRALTNFLLGKIIDARADAEAGLFLENSQRFETLQAMIQALSEDPLPTKNYLHQLELSGKKNSADYLSVDFTLELGRQFSSGDFMTMTPSNAVRIVTAMIPKWLAMQQSDFHRGFSTMGWFSDLLKGLPLNPVDAFLFLSSEERRAKTFHHLALKLPDHQIVQFLHYGGSNMSHREGFEILNHIVSCDTLSPIIRDSAYFGAIGELGQDQSQINSTGGVQAEVIKLVSNVIELRNTLGRFPSGLFDANIVYLMLLRQGFHGPAELIAVDERDRAKDDAAKNYWQARIDLAIKQREQCQKICQDFLDAESKNK